MLPKITFIPASIANRRQLEVLGVKANSINNIAREGDS